VPDGTPRPASRHPAETPGDGASRTLTDAACGALSGAAVGDALGGAAEGYTPDDVAATFYQTLGIDHHKEYHTNTGRPVMIVRDGKVIQKLFA
jgi:hypothetical protein